VVPGTLLSIITEDMHGFMSSLHGLKGKNLDLILHSPGGSPESAEQIVNYLRAKYDHIRAIIPQNAMSAATMIACGCDSIVMGKHSALGPIDPQITFSDGQRAYTSPAQAILDEFDEAKREIQTSPGSAPLWAERIQRYPYGFLQSCQNAIALSKEMVRRWLEQYMFHDEADAAEKAQHIAGWLGTAGNHKTHGRPLSMRECQSNGLKITALEDDQDLQEGILSLFHAMVLTFDGTPCVKIVENHEGRGMFLNVSVR
jgi:hypothetical protein